MRTGSCPRHCARRHEEHHGSVRRTSWLRRWWIPSTVVSGLAALLWLLFRTGTKPSRITYPCQQASLATATTVLGPSLIASVLAVRCGVLSTLRWLVRKTTAAYLVVSVAALAGLWIAAGGEEGGGAVLVPPAGYRAEIFLVNESRGRTSDGHGGVDDLVELMGLHGFKWYRSATATRTSGPNGMLDKDDVVLIKVNGQWSERGGTNCDVLAGVIRRIVEHPDGFAGEVVVADNGQGRGNLNPSQSNAEDRSRSTVDVVSEFRSEGWNVSAMLWDSLRWVEADEFADGDMRSGYCVSRVVDSDTRIRASYPKFRTSFGTYVSYKHGIWSEDSGAYDRDKLVVINMPVLKTHSIYAITASVKNHMGVVTKEQGTDSHNAVGRGGMGTILSDVRMPDLHIMDCIWILARPGSGPAASYGAASRRDQLVASTDPIALDAWATKFIMMPQIIDNGYGVGAYGNTQDPDNPDSVFRRYLDRSMSEILRAGIDTTNDYEAVDLHVWTGEPGTLFLRGDANDDGTLDISDPITTLIFEFLGGPPPPCADAADADDDGVIDLTDAIFSLAYLYQGGPSPPPPFPDAGVDPTADELECLD